LGEAEPALRITSEWRSLPTCTTMLGLRTKRLPMGTGRLATGPVSSLGPLLPPIGTMLPPPLFNWRWRRWRWLPPTGESKDDALTTIRIGVPPLPSCTLELAVLGVLMPRDCLRLPKWLSLSTEEWRLPAPRGICGGTPRGLLPVLDMPEATC